MSIEDAAQESPCKPEATYRRLVSHIPAIVCEMAPDGTTRFVNDAVTRITGYRPEELLGRNWWEMLCPGDQYPILKRLLSQGLQTEATEREVILTAKNGATKTLLWSSSKRHSEDGTLECIVGFGVDITQRRRIPETLQRGAQFQLAAKHVEEELEQSFQKLHRILEGTIKAMALTVEMRDPYTAGHQRRVAELATAIGREMDLRCNQTQSVRLAGLIHDIGKINVPAEILSKPGPISDFEFGMIKAHPQVGYDILKTIEFPWPLAEIVLQHHEMLDGSGYPSGLMEKDILPEARILAVADLVEAMASHRPYRPALGIDKALRQVAENREILYDPNVVDACLRVFYQKGFQFESPS